MRFGNIMWLVVFVCAASFLYSVKYHVQEMDEEIVALRTELAKEHESFHVLNAEWAFLTRPERVRTLAKRHLRQMEPTAGTQIADVAALPYSAEVLEKGRLFAGSEVPVPEMRPGVHPVSGVAYAQ